MGRMKLIMLAALGAMIVIVAVVDLITSTMSSILGINVAYEISCMILIIIIVIIAIPWFILGYKFKEYRKIKQIEDYEQHRNCSACGNELTLTKFGKYCERCRKYD
jgi:hypothetical protein